MQMTAKKDDEKFASALSASPLEANLCTNNPSLHLKASHLPSHRYHHHHYLTTSECELDFRG